jgi:hypothetical protein
LLVFKQRLFLRTAVKPWHVQMGWTMRPAVNAVVLAPRVGGIVRELLGVEDVRLYHDNTLSRCPGSPRTKWHCDDGPDKHMAMETLNVVTGALFSVLCSTVWPLGKLCLG